MMTPIHIELLYFDGCPSYKTAWADLLEVVAEHDLEVTVNPTKVESIEQANALHFAGSPTIKVNGRDLEGYRGEGVMACRIYEENGGKGYPSKVLLRTQLTKGANQHEQTKRG